MIRKINIRLVIGLVSLVLSTLTAPVALYAAGGSSMGGGGGGSSMSMPKKSPQQLAVSNYNAGIKNRDKAEELEVQLASADTPKQRKKLEKKITKQYKKAVKRFRASVKKVSSFYQAHASLGYTLKQLGDFDDAMATYNHALRLRPQYTPAIEYRAEAYLALKNFDGVKEAHTQLARYDPNHKQELEGAIMEWLDTNDRTAGNQDFYDWASGLNPAS